MSATAPSHNADKKPIVTDDWLRDDWCRGGGGREGEGEGE